MRFMYRFASMQLYRKVFTRSIENNWLRYTPPKWPRLFQVHEFNFMFLFQINGLSGEWYDVMVLLMKKQRCKYYSENRNCNCNCNCILSDCLQIKCKFFISLVENDTIRYLIGSFRIRIVIFSLNKRSINNLKITSKMDAGRHWTDTNHKNCPKIV